MSAWINIRKMSDAPPHDCVVAYITWDQIAYSTDTHKSTGTISGLNNLGGLVGHLEWGTLRDGTRVWSITNDGECVQVYEVAALCEIPSPLGLKIEPHRGDA